MRILSAEFVTSATGPKQFPSDRRPQIAFAGRSNVGKSSVINALLHRKNLVKTSATPGKTQLINFFIINDAFYFVDLPGYGYARVPYAVTEAWGPMIEGYLKDSPELHAVVVLLDVRREPDERDVRLIEWLRQYDIPAIFAVTKADKLNRQEAERARRNILSRLEMKDPVLLTSAKNGLGIKELWGEINKKMKNEKSKMQN
ncbi:MAG TPA: ribosome biogenesis GTP-binding protein YihA/YsxC [Nitrospirota bacterium]|nr:ribosome biogenesis GTP-binding protein YihA/YsxC [Nitrospirota bacterium]